MFDLIINYILEHEGGFNNHPEDRGGPTKWGISLRFLKLKGLDINKDQRIDIKDIKEVGYEKAVELYKKYFWNKDFENLDINIAAKLFDTTVNMGERQAVKILQRAVNNINCTKLKVDGILGPKTIAATKTSYIKNRTVFLTAAFLLIEMQFEQIQFYLSICRYNPSQLKFIQGWYNRARWVPDL